jgi:hypothetical protein
MASKGQRFSRFLSLRSLGDLSGQNAAERRWASGGLGTVEPGLAGSTNGGKTTCQSVLRSKVPGSGRLFAWPNLEIGAGGDLSLCR